MKITKLVLIMAIAFSAHSTLQANELKPNCPAYSKCQTDLQSLIDHKDVLESWLSSATRKQATMDSVAQIAYSSEYFETRLESLRLLEISTLSLHGLVRGKAITLTRSIALRSNNEELELEAIRILSNPMNSFVVDVAFMAISAVEDIALNSQSEYVKLFAESILQGRIHAVNKYTRERAQEALAKIQTAGK